MGSSGTLTLFFLFVFPQPEKLDPGEPLEDNLLSVRKPTVGRTHSLPNDSYMFHPLQPLGHAAPAPAQLLAQTQRPQHISGSLRAQSGNAGLFTSKHLKHNTFIHFSTHLIKWLIVIRLEMEAHTFYRKGWSQLRKMQLFPLWDQNTCCKSFVVTDPSVLCLFVCRVQWLGAFTAWGLFPEADSSIRPLQTHQPPQPLGLREYTTTAASQTHTHAQPHTSQTGELLIRFLVFTLLWIYS